MCQVNQEKHNFPSKCSRHVPADTGSVEHPFQCFLIMMVALGIIVAALLCAPKQAHADDFATIGFGPSLDGTTNPKEFALGFEKTWGELALYTHCGLLFESETNGYCATVLGVHIETPSGLFTRAGVGPAYVAHTDDRISSHLNANIVFAVGAYQGPAYFALEASHISNAGVVPPNLGADHVLAQIGWRFE